MKKLKFILIVLAFVSVYILRVLVISSLGGASSAATLV
jgi:hypothetical protein